VTFIKIIKKIINVSTMASTNLKLYHYVSLFSWYVNFCRLLTGSYLQNNFTLNPQKTYTWWIHKNYCCSVVPPSCKCDPFLLKYHIITYQVMMMMGLWYTNIYVWFIIYIPSETTREAHNQVCVVVNKRRKGW